MSKIGVSDNSQIFKIANRDGVLQEVYRECLVDVKELPDGKNKPSDEILHFSHQSKTRQTS